jgi:hypothetical protein
MSSLVSNLARPHVLISHIKLTFNKTLLPLQNPSYFIFLLLCFSFSVPLHISNVPLFLLSLIVSADSCYSLHLLFFSLSLPPKFFCVTLRLICCNSSILTPIFPLLLYLFHTIIFVSFHSYFYFVYISAAFCLEDGGNSGYAKSSLTSQTTSHYFRHSGHLNSPPLTVPLFFFYGSAAPVGPDFYILEVSRSYSDTPQYVGLLWTSDRSDTETSTWQHTTLTRGRHSCPRRDSNPKSQEANGRRPTPWTTQPLASAHSSYTCLRSYSLPVAWSVRSYVLFGRVKLTWSNKPKQRTLVYHDARRVCQLFVTQIPDRHGFPL